MSQIKKADGFGEGKNKQIVSVQEPKSNRKHKDTLFRYIFKEKSAMLELYNALFNDNLTDESQIEDCTLEDVLYQNRKNDLAFRAKGRRVIILAEHQSTINENMPVRFLIYLGRTYERLLQNENIYAKRQLNLDSPVFVVFYNGTDDYPKEWEMRLSDAFPKGIKHTIDLVVKVYNMNYYNDLEVIKRAELLREYSIFIDSIRQYLNEGMSNSKAIELAIRENCDMVVLKETLEHLGSEVINMLTEEFDMERAMKVWKKECEEIGMEKGMEKGMEAALIKMIKSKRKLHVSEDAILEELVSIYDLTAVDARKLMASVK